MSASHSSQPTATPGLLRLLLAPGTLVARGVALRAVISVAVWIVLIVGVAVGVRLAMSSGLTGQAAAPVTSRAANGPVDAEGGPLAPSSRAAAAYVSEQIVPRPVVRAAPVRPTPRVANDAPPAPAGPTVATDREAQRTMQGLY